MRSIARWPLALVVVLATATLSSCREQPTGLDQLAAVPGKGNGAPSGPHYNLNIIGMSKGKTADMTGNNGHRIFVNLGNKDGSAVRSKILLSQSTDGSFGVLDANGTDGPASFKLPYPGTYSIWARPLGKPGGRARMTTCVDDPDYGEICSTEYYLGIRKKGKRSFSNVTAELTTIELVEGSPEAELCGTTTVSLFDPCLDGYFWAYDNNGLRLLQLRFYYYQ